MAIGTGGTRTVVQVTTGKEWVGACAHTPPPWLVGQFNRKTSTRSLPRAIKRDSQVATARALRTQYMHFLLHMMISERAENSSRIAPAHHVETTYDVHP
jgi:hypothetical protein